jgi:hypothetical protein
MLRRDGEFHSGAHWMLFGHNTNVTVGDVTYHVQTEDRGSSHALPWPRDASPHQQLLRLASA